MISRNIDLEQLEAFQKKCKEWYQELWSLGKELEANADEACVFLQDESSAQSIKAIRDLGTELGWIGRYGETCMCEYLANTRRRLEEWEQLRRG